MALFDPAASGVRSNPKTAILGLIGLAVFLAWQALLTRTYVRTDTRPPSWDQAVHLEIAWDYWQAARAGRWSDVVHLAPKSGMPPFPPLYHLFLTRAYSAPRPAQAAIWLNWYYLAVLCVCLFGILYHFRADQTALWATLAFACAPAVQDLYFTQLVDLAVVACSAAAFWALLLSEEFRAWPGSLAFGALFAVGMLHKWSFFSYMFPAYFLALKNLGEERSRWKILAAAAVALAGCGPWYWVHLPVLIPRLFQASSDFAVPVWRGGAVVSYLFSSADGLGPLLWAFGWIGLVAPYYRRHAARGWLVAAWVLSAYVFWTIVPNRQLRFLLPGLPALAVTLCAAWPATIVWVAAATQILVGFNFAKGWIAPVRLALPFYDMTLFPSDPPRAEDWKIDAVLREAQKRAPEGGPASNLTLVANAPFFNGPNFTWTQKALGLSRLHIRGVNKRLCELSRFVVLKDAQLGPAGVIGGLPEAALAITARDGWFQKGYVQAAKWPLPDGSNALLFEQRRLPRPPFANPRTQFQYYESSAFAAQDFLVDLGRFDPASGSYPAATARARTITFRGLKLSDVAIEADGLVILPAGLPGTSEWEEVRLLKLSRLRLRSARVTADDFRDFLETRVRGLHMTSLKLDKTIAATGTFSNLPVAAEASAELLQNPRRLRLTALAARVGAASLPVSWLGPFGSYVISLEPNPETPFVIDAAGLTIAGGRLTIP